MRKYIGIDLGTTNSVICTYDGKQTQVWKSPEQNDVTPSAIYVDKRGCRYYGRRAYEMAPVNEKNAATLFKRYMGTNKVFSFEATGETLTSEECSAEILKVLFGYLPEEIRNDSQIGTVITVPAAFNQMKKDATLEAARLAGIGQVALMQEPVAAVMSVMKKDSSEKTFLIYDLGGGTFDVSVAENIAGRVSLLTQGGKEMCGGRDWDRMIYRKIVEPWLKEHFNLSADAADATMRKVNRLALLAVEQAKIELSANEATTIRMDEARLNATDLNGNELYLDIPFQREELNALIADMIDDTVDVTRETLRKVGLKPEDIEQIVFVGGPTSYKPLRDCVIRELGVRAGVEVNPMTAVAEGAAIYAESIDWSTQQHNRKPTKGERMALPNLKINYERRTSADSGRIAFLTDDVGFSVEVVCNDTGWVSGKIAVDKRLIVEVPLATQGENNFTVTLYDSQGAINIENNHIEITRTLGTVNSIPASFPIAVKALDKIGGKAVPIYLIEENDYLPKKGSVTFRAGQTLVAGSSGALVFTLWEGGIREPIEDNRYIGTYRIPGTSFFSGVIPQGAEIICDYEMNESGTLHLGVSVPSVGVSLNDQNFYSRVDGQSDLRDAPGVVREIDGILQRTQEMKLRINDPEIDRVREVAFKAKESIRDDDPEAIQAAENDLLDCRRRVALIKQRHLKEIRLLDLESNLKDFERVEDKATISEIAAVKNLEDAAHKSIEQNSPDFDTLLDEMRSRMIAILWRQDDFIKGHFRWLVSQPDRFTNRAQFDRLRASGIVFMENNDIDKLRGVIGQLQTICAQTTRDENMFDDVNIIRG